MKKFLATLIAVLSLVLFVGCNSAEESSSAPSQSESVSQPTDADSSEEQSSEEESSQAPSDIDYSDLNTTSSDAGVNAQYELILTAIEEAYAAGTPATTQEVADAITAAVPVQNPGAIDDQRMEFLGVPIDIVEEYTGSVAMINISSDELLVIRATDGNVDAVVQAMVKRRDDKIAEWETYLPNEFAKAQASVIVVNGNDVIYANLGDVTTYDMYVEE